MLRFILLLIVVFSQTYASEDVSFHIRQGTTGLSIFGKELGVEKFRADVNFETFTNQANNNFYLCRFKDGLCFQYQNARTKELFGLLVRENGYVKLLEYENGYTGWDQRKTYGIRTFGTLENRGNQAFYHLVTSANELHNYGTIQTRNVRLAQNYLFNSGVLQFGNLPTDSGETLTNSDAEPLFKEHTIENYGTFLSRNTLQIKNGLHYHEHGMSDFENLETSGGDMQVEGGMMAVDGTLSGSIRDLSIQNAGSLNYKQSTIKEVRDLSVGIESILHAEEAIQMKVSRTYTNQGSIMSDDRINLQIENMTANQNGTLYAPSGVSTRVLSAERVRARYEAECRERDRREAERQRQAQIAQENARKEREAAEKEIESCKQMVNLVQQYVDWAEKFIHAVEKDEFEADMRAQGYRKLDDGSWMRQRRKKGGFCLSAGIGSSGFHFGGHTRGYNPFPIGGGGGMTSMMQQAMAYREMYRANLNSGQAMLRESMAKAERLSALERQHIYTAPIPVPSYYRAPDKVGNIYTKVTPAVSQIRDREYINRLSRTIGANHDQVSALETELRKLRDRPEIRTQYEPIIREATHTISDLSLDSPTQEFINDYIITPLSIASAIIPQTRMASMAYQGAKVAVAFAESTVARTAVAATVGEAYKRITTFFNEKTKGIERTTPEYGKGEFWNGLITKSQNPKLIAISRKAKADVRVDKDGFFYKFDPAHKTIKVHLHKYKYVGGDSYQLVEEVNPINGVRKIVTKGKVETW